MKIIYIFFWISQKFPSHSLTLGPAAPGGPGGPGGPCDDKHVTKLDVAGKNLENWRGHELLVSNSYDVR